MKKILIIFTVIVFVLSLNKNVIENKNDTIRFRIIANSNNIEDQEIKAGDITLNEEN